MINIVKKYMQKNWFLISVMITGVMALVMGIFYALLKSKRFMMAEEKFLENTSVLGPYITLSAEKPDTVKYFIIIFLIALGFILIVSLILSIYLKKRYIDVFNLFSILNIILILGFLGGIVFLNISFLIAYILLILISILYLFVLYKCLYIFKLENKKRILSLLIFIIPLILILIILKLFV